MKNLADNYKWEAVRNGEIITKGGDLAGCEKFSLIPKKLGLPRLDVVGVEIIRRFNRGFDKVKMGQEKLPVKLLWEKGSDKLKTPDDMTGYLQSGSLIARVGVTFPWYVVTDVTADAITIHKPYEGKTKEAETRVVAQPGNKKEYLYCVVCKGFRIYVNARTGQVTTTPEDYELYL